MTQAVLQGHLASTNPAASRFGAFVTGFGKSFTTALRISREWESRAMEMRQLSALSDAELSAKGLNRDRIPAHVFHEIFED